MLITIVVLLLIILSLTFILVRISRCLFQFDKLFQLFVDDIDTNLRFFEKLMKTPLFSDSEEVRNAHKNMNIIHRRLEEFKLRMISASNR